MISSPFSFTNDNSTSEMNDDMDVLGLRQLDNSSSPTPVLFDSPTLQSSNMNMNPHSPFHVPTQQLSSSALPEPQVVSDNSYFAFNTIQSSYDALMTSAMFAVKAEDAPLSLPNSKSEFYPFGLGFDLSAYAASPANAYAAAARLSDAAHVDPDYHQFLHAALFNEGEDEDEGVPELEPDIPENDAHDEEPLFDFQPAVYSFVAAQGDSPAMSTSGSEYIPTPHPPLPEHQVVTSSSTRSRKATGFRGAATPLIPLEAPIQPRSYATESTTSRKRKTVAIERKLAKRTPTPAFSKEEVEEEEIPEDLLEAAERKRLQNTLSARKSRLRKQERLGELEEENRILKGDKLTMARRISELEDMLRGLGLQP